MPGRSQNQSETRGPIKEPPSPKEGSLPGRSGQKKDDLASYEAAKKAFFKKVWQAVPRRWRIPSAAVLFIAGGLAASHSVWYPTVEAWINPPAQRLSLGGWVFLQASQAHVDAEVQLLNKQGDVVSIASTDPTGFVSFNISSDDRLANLRCTGTNDETITVPLNAAAVAKGKRFQLFLDQTRIEYREP